jgi:hypothetical protein
LQNPNEDTEWNDVLRAKGILPPKPKEHEITEDEIQGMIDQAIHEKSDGTLHSGFYQRGMGRSPPSNNPTGISPLNFFFLFSVFENLIL